ncbi:MAG TPA: (5-formylfuran-3-yl)methyl phosphate synthase, partial [Gemmatimonadales bacterium]|nr:(5-formylfuran-3-yl)methyl phosphate synthase [Gemmatimonadales bacterium]
TLQTVAAAGPEVIGVRGAACDGGREGHVSAERVGCLRRRLDAGGMRGFLESPALVGRGAWRNA